MNKTNPEVQQVVSQPFGEQPVTDFLTELNRRNIQLWVEGGSLRYKAPKGEMTPEIIGFLRERKEELIQSLRFQAEASEKARAIFYEPIPTVPLETTSPVPLEYPLSSAQKRMFVSAQLNPEQTGYNLTQVLKLVGTVQLERIQAVIAKLIERHEILRTSFESVEGNLVQRIHPSLDFMVEYMETDAASGASATKGGGAADTIGAAETSAPAENGGAGETELEALIHQFIRPYDLKRLPLFRVRLVKLNGNGASGRDTYLLLYDIHHIISDGVSLGVFTKEINYLYADRILPPVTVQYKDFTLWHEKLRQSDFLQPQKEHWLKQFQGEIPVLNLLPDYQRPSVYRFDGGNVKQWIGPETTAAINQFARKNQATLYQVLFSAYFILLARLSGQSDLVVGTPTAGRRHADLNEVMGIFVNTLAIRSFPEPGKTFRCFLEEVSLGLLRAFDNQDYPFETLVEELKIERDLSRNPLFDTMFVLQNMDLGDLEIPGLEITPYEFENPIAKFDLTLTVTESASGICFRFEYCAALFKQETIERLAGYFRNLLEAVTADPDIRLDRIEIMTKAERNRILHAFNDTRAEYPKDKTIHRLFEEQVERTPDHIAVVFNDQRITYRELNRGANHVASRLRSKGIQPDSIIAITAERSRAMIIAILGILKAGGAYLPIDPEYPEDRIGFMLEDSEASLLLIQHHLLDKVAFRGEIIDLDDETIYYGADLNPEPQTKPQNLAYIIYTSGTTGKPKGAMIEHRNVVRLLFNEKLQFDFNANDSWTMFHSFCFDFSVWEMYGALLYGGQLIMVPKSIAQDPIEYLKLLKERRVTVLNQTPTAFYNLMNEELKCDDYSLALRYVVFGGEALQPGMLKDWRKKYPGIKLINMYGITETTVHVTYKEITFQEIERNISNIGKPIPTLTTYITDRELRLQPIGVPGELCVGGDGVGRGYLNKPELTAERFVLNSFWEGSPQGGPQRGPLRIYRSGDLARFLPNGDLEYLGRIDQQVKIRGHRIELQEIESVVLQYEPVREAVVILREDANGNKNLCAYYVAERAIPIAEFRGYLGLKLPEYMIPAYFVPLDKIPLTSNHKVDRKQLPEPGGQTGTEHEYEAPRNETEAKLAEIWQAVLKSGSIGTNDNFFHAGGDSIKAIHLISTINQVFHTNIKIKDLYLHQTIKELSEYLQTFPKELVNDLENGLRLIQDRQQSILTTANQVRDLPEGYEDFYPLSYIQQGMVFFTKLRPEEPVYHDQFPYLFKIEQFNLEAFNSALKLLIQRHPILRTTFHVEHFGEPIQVTHSSQSKIIPGVVMEDLRSYGVTLQEQKIKEYMVNDLQNKFTFENQLLWRMRLFKLGDQEYCLILSFQHAILDGWSVASLIRELVETFEIRLQGKNPDAGPLKSSYKDYVAINLSRADARGKTGGQAREFWKEYLQGFTRNKLPFNISSRKIGNTGGSRILRRSLDLRLEQGLEQKAEYYQCALQEICLAAHVYLLGVITTETDIVTGVVSHDRPAIPDGDKILGCFLNTVPVRIQVDTEINKANFIKTIRNRLRDVKVNELFLADIAEILGERGVSGNPVFDTLLNYTDFHVLEGITKVGLAKPMAGTIKVQSNEMTNTLFDLEVSRTLGTFLLQIKYNPDYFYDEDIKAAADLYQRILEEIAFNDDPYLGSEGLLTREQITELVYDFNLTQTEYPKEKTMNRLFEEQAWRTPEQVALVFGEQQLTYRELNEKANQVGRLLMERGVKSGDYVALVTRRGLAMIIGMMAVLKCGGAYVPIDPDYPAARQKYIADNSKVTAILTKEGYGNVGHDNIIVMDEANLNQYSVENPDLPKDSRDLAYVIYTSGSTGAPKGVMIEHHSAVNLILWVNREFRVNEQDALLFLTSMCFDLSVYDIFGTLAAGGKVVIAGKEQVQNPDQLKLLLLKHSITFWDTVPSTMNYLVNTLTESDPKFIQSNLRLVFLSGDWIPVSLPRRLKQYFPNAEVISLGGATEGTVWSNYYPVESGLEYQISIPYGRPIANNYFYILDRNMKVVPKGVAGELYIGGVGVARGYMNDEERTRASFMPNRFLEPAADKPAPMMYKTGDLGRMLPDGNIEFLGRMDYQVKIRGYRVELGEIENKLMKHPGVREAVAIDRVDTLGVKYLCAYIVWRDPVTVAEMREYLASELPDYMIPTYFLGIEQIPLTQNGKIDRKALPEPEGNLSTGTEYVSPQNEVQRMMADIWQEALGVAKVGMNDDFFDLGGHSIMAMNISVLSKKKGLELPVQAIFRYTTIAKISENLDLKFTRKTDYPDQDIPVENAGDLHQGIKHYQFGPNQRKELRIEMQREVTSYLFRAYPLCIVLAFDNLRAWYYQRMIQICAQIHDDDYVIVDYMEKFDFTSEVLVNIKLGHEGAKDIGNIVNYIIEKINDGYYVSICLDEYHLKGKPQFRSQHFVHETLIYGYDNLEKKFSGLGFDENGIFNALTLEYNAVTMAFEDALIYYPDSAPYAAEQTIRLFRPRDIETEYPFDSNAFLQGLNHYVCSKGAISEINYIVPPTLKSDYLTQKNLRYGLKVSQVVVDRLERMIRGEILIDYRVLHLMAEHKRGLLARFKYMSVRMGLISETADILAEYGLIVDDFETIRVESLKVMNSESKNDLFRYLERIIEHFKSSIEKEKLILGALYQGLSGGQTPG